MLRRNSSPAMDKVDKLAQAPNPLEGATTALGRLMDKHSAFGSGEMAHHQNTPQSLQDIAIGRGFGSSGVIENYTPLTPHSVNRLGFNALQQFPSDERGQWPEPGLVGQLAIPYKPMNGSGWKAQEVLSFDSDWMPASLWFQRAANEAEKKKEYNTLGDDFYFIFKHDPTRQHALEHEGDYKDAGDWVLVDKLRKSDAHHSSGVVDLLLMSKDQKTNAEREDPLTGLLNTIASPEAAKFRTEHGPKGYKKKLDMLIVAIGRHFNPNDKYTYTDRKELTARDKMLVSSYINTNQKDPLRLAVPLIAFEEYMKLDVFEAKKKKTPGGLTEHDKFIIESRRDEIREEVLEAVGATTVEHSLKGLLKTGQGEDDYVHPMRWIARIITPADMIALRVLAENENSPCRGRALQLLQLYSQVRQNFQVPSNTSFLHVEETNGNQLIRSSSYKPGMGNLQAGDLFYIPGNEKLGRCMPVEPLKAPFPLEIQYSFIDRTKKNMVAGIVAEVQARGPLMTGGDERYLIVDGKATHAKIALGGLKYFKTIQDRVRASGNNAVLPYPPTMTELLFADTGKPEITVATRNEKGLLRATTVLLDKSGVVYVQEAGGHKVRPEKAIATRHNIESAKDAGDHNDGREVGPDHYFTVKPLNISSGEVVLAGLHNLDTLHINSVASGPDAPIQAMVMLNDPSRLEQLIKEHSVTPKNYGRNSRTKNGER